MFKDIGQFLLLVVGAARALPESWRRRRSIAEQLFEIGNGSLFMASVLSLFIGGVLALQTGPVLADRGLGSLMGSVIGVSACRELSPVMMAILVAGRVGSAMAAELGSMRVYQEIDALRTLNIDPVRYLVLPRLVGISIALPLLVLFSIMLAWFGGAVVCAFNNEIGVSFQAYFGDLKSMLDLDDLANGLAKSFVFAVSVGAVCCYQGLRTVGGPRGIGRSVTKAVVNSIVLILILDYFVTRALMHFD